MKKILENRAIEVIDEIVENYKLLSRIFEQIDGEKFEKKIEELKGGVEKIETWKEGIKNEK